ncbi:hypothetical protein ScPMuIL_007148 [Solemya velum]
MSGWSFLPLCGLLLVSLVGANPVKDCVKKADIYFVLDVSMTTLETNLDDMKDFVRRVMKDFDVDSNDVRIGLMTFNTVPRIEFNLAKYHTESDLVKAIKNMDPPREGFTMTELALKMLREKAFTAAQGDRCDAMDVVFVLTDGRSNHPARTVTEAELNRQAGIFTYSIGVTDVLDVDELRAIENRIHPLHTDVDVDEDGLLKITERDICHVFRQWVPPTQASTQAPTQVPTTITPSQAGRCVKQADLYFVLDVSSSITESDFQNMKDFAIRVTENFQVGGNGVRVGLITFSNTPKIESNLVKHQTLQDVTLAIGNLHRNRNGFTQTHLALNLVREQAFTTANGGRPHVIHVVFILTDGRSNHPSQTIAEADKNKRAGIHTFSIGVTDVIDVAELIAIENPIHPRPHTAQDVRNLLTVSEQDICQLFNASLSTPPTPSPISTRTTVVSSAATQVPTSSTVLATKQTRPSIQPPSTTSPSMSTISRSPSTTNQQISTTNPLPYTTSHSSFTTNQPLSTTNHLTSTTFTINESVSIYSQPSSNKCTYIYNEPASFYNGPACTDNGPACTDNEPACIDNESANIDNESASIYSQPSSNKCTYIYNEPACIDNESACTDNEPACTDNEPACIDNESACIDNEPACIDNESACIDNESASIYSQPACINNEPACIDNESACIDNESACIDNEPACIDNESACIDNESACIDNESACIDNEPACIDNESACIYNESACIDNESACIDNEPACIDNESACIDNESAFIDNEPACIDNESACIDNESAFIDNESTSIYNQPSSIYNKYLYLQRTSLFYNEQPVSTTNQPVSTTTQPLSKSTASGSPRLPLSQYLQDRLRPVYSVHSIPAHAEAPPPCADLARRSVRDRAGVCPGLVAADVRRGRLYGLDPDPERPQ